MADKPQAGVLGSLPRTRPHRRSAKRSPAEPATDSSQAPAAAANSSAAEAKAAPAKPAATKPKRAPKPTAKVSSAKSKAPTTAQAKAPARATAQAKAPATAKAHAKAPATAKAKAPTPHGHGTQPRTQAPRAPAPGRTPAATDPEVGPLGTAVQAAAELAEIGMMASARALRGALSRLPRR
jgi:homospermidine synthase